MDADDIKLSRISKLFVDRDDQHPDAALTKRKQFRVTLLCGADVTDSYTLQLAVLTAASIAARCFPGGARVVLPDTLQGSPCLIWPELKWTFGRALADILGADAFEGSVAKDAPGFTLVFGRAEAPGNSLRVTFDGWTARVGPTREVPRLQERQYCSLAGVLAAGLAMSEIFLSFSDISIEACRRVVSLSLWRPDLDAMDPEALGVPVEYLPKALWLLGLGHLGNGYAWSLGTLPYADPREAEFALFDYDKVIAENTETGLVFSNGDIGKYKTRALNRWFEDRKFATRIVERRFDATFRVQDGEPGLALCGFDSNPARRDLKMAEFRRVIESGLGGTASNFDTINLHTLPNPRSVEVLWPDLKADQAEKQRQDKERIARTSKAYEQIDHDECGRIELAGKAVAVPFVGTIAGAFVVGEVLRLLHEGTRFTDLKLRLGVLNNGALRNAGSYTAQDLVGVDFVAARTIG